jgi:7-cyano-7-deazaguanine synthase in queuosine biosynthesis
MIRQRVFQYHFTSHGNAQFGEDWERLSDSDFHDLPRHMESLTAVADPERVWAQDLVRIAKAVYLADRRSPRRMAPDGWTRTIRLSIQLSAPDRWSDQQETDLGELLQLLTGDLWDVHVHGGAVSQPTLHDDLWATDVALFSGGLDSTAYAGQLASRLDGEKRALFITYDWNLQAPQRHVFSEIKKMAPDRFRMIQTRLNPKARGRKLDGTNRSRSLLFIATAVCVAAIQRVTRVAVPENGQLAINPALTPGRLSACSTRSVHPWTLHLINRLIIDVGGDVMVHNPFLGLTKGDVCREAHDAGLTLETLQRTVSCGHPTTARAHDNPDYHCGHCFPCLVRRAGLHVLLAGQPDHSGYMVDPADLDPLDMADTKATDLRDLAYWLAQEFTSYDLIADAPLPPDTPLDTVMSVLRRGRDELIAMITDLTPANSLFRQHWAPRTS